VAVELRGRGLLVGSAAEDERAFASAEEELTRRLDNATLLYLVLVQGCNFRCSYCPIPDLSRETGELLMTPETATEAVNLWAEHVREGEEQDSECLVILYGGEPLLNMPALAAAVEHIEHLQAAGYLPRDRLSVMVCTNGVLIDRFVARFFREHQVSVAVGCDGPPDAHDAIRWDVNGKPSHERVLAALGTLAKEGVTTFVSAAITPHNLDKIEHFSDYFAGLGVAKFGFNFLRGKLLFRLVPVDQLQDYYERATDGVLRNLDNFGGQHMEYQVERKFMAFLQRRYFPTDCNGYGNQVVVEPGGQIGNCPFIRGDMGNVHAVGSDFRMRSQPTVRRWRTRLPLFNPACRPCDAKSICGGGCAWNALELKGDPMALDDAMCLLTRKVFERLVWASLPSSKG
jgi:uncharacterized protein